MFLYNISQKLDSGTMRAADRHVYKVSNRVKVILARNECENNLRTSKSAESKVLGIFGHSKDVWSARTHCADSNDFSFSVHYSFSPCWCYSREPPWRAEPKLLFTVKHGLLAKTYSWLRRRSRDVDYFFPAEVGNVEL